MQRITIFLSILFILSTQVHIHAQTTEEKMRILPAYCKARHLAYSQTKISSKKNAFIKKWKTALGNDFLHIHHY